MTTTLHSPFLEDFSADDAAALAAQLKAIADPARLRILGLLRTQGPMRGADLVPLLGLAQPTVSHHLGILRAAGLIEDHQLGRDTVRVLRVQACTALATLIDPTGGGR